MTILCDSLIPSAKSLFRSFGELHFFSERLPSRDLLADAEILLVRSITPVTQELLIQAPNLRFVGTATIGVDHLDTTALDRAGIAWCNAPGCNALSVGNYVITALLAARVQQGLLDWPRGNAAVIGAGHTGRATGRKLSALGLTVHFIDPPLLEAARKGEVDLTAEPYTGLSIHADWQRLQDAQVVSCHVPLTSKGNYPTHGLFDTERLSLLRDDCWLINASRGPVVSAAALIERRRRGEMTAILDVWEHEPRIDQSLLPYLAFATPHIAGHSIEGKLGGSWQLYQQLCSFLDQPQTVHWESLLPMAPPVRELHGELSVAELVSWLLALYDIGVDDDAMRRLVIDEQSFYRLRQAHSHTRRDVESQRVQITTLSAFERLQQLGFQVSRA